MNLNKEMRIVMLGIVLCLICAISTAAMAYASVVTKAPIEKAKAADLIAGFQQVLPPFDNRIDTTGKFFKTADGQDVEIYTAFLKGKIVGYAVRTSAVGYGGKVEGLLGLTPEGGIRTFIITHHNETPGLGSQAADRIRKKTIFNLFKCDKKEEGLLPNRLLDSFAGHSAADSDPWGSAPWSVKKDGGKVDAVSGATISSRAVTKIAWKAASVFMQNKESITKAQKGN